MKVSVDFDGVLTQPWPESDLVGLDQHALLLSTLSISGSAPRPGIRSVVGFLQTFASVEIMTARPPKQHSAISSWLRANVPSLVGAAMHSCPTEAKAEYAAARGIVLHIDDDPRVANESFENCVVWGAQSFKALLRELVAIPALREGLEFQQDPVRHLVELPSHSATPVYRFDSGGRSFKIRVVSDVAQSENLQRIHRACGDSDLLSTLLPQEVPGTAPGIHVTPFMPGETVASRRPANPAGIADSVAKWLVALHESTMESDANCVISCACDAFNLCVDAQGAATIIDASDCCRGPRWVDLVWTEQLLGPWLGGVDELFETYFALATERPSPDEVRRATAGYYYRLHHVLRAATQARAGDESDVEAVKKVVSKRAVPPSESLLERFAR